MADDSIRFCVDIGGTGIKAAPVNVRVGELQTARVRVETPHASTPAAVVGVVAQLVHDAKWTGEVGAAFPAVIKDGVARSGQRRRLLAGHDVAATLPDATGCDVYADIDIDIDADAPGSPRCTSGPGCGRSRFPRRGQAAACPAAHRSPAGSLRRRGQDGQHGERCLTSIASRLVENASLVPVLPAAGRPMVAALG